MKNILVFKAVVEEYLHQFSEENKGGIYDPVDYILSLGGKRLRPCLLMAIAKALRASESASLPMAAAVEMFHNFTLLHDDIMDEANTRRGYETVHLKWNRDQAILSGDIMFALSYELLMKSTSPSKDKAFDMFTTTAKEVCIGQQMDMDFEAREDVTEEEYLEMIRLKTSVLIGASAAMGAIAANASPEAIRALYEYGQHLGISFQMQDDILDAFGESAAVGKRPGGDILQNKKTLLYLKALELAGADQKEELLRWYGSTEESTEKVESVKGIMRATGALNAVREVQEEHLDIALKNLEKVDLKDEWHEEFKSLALHQLQRTF
jgi:geranylgeranyl diphosphate synthase type II